MRTHIGDQQLSDLFKLPEKWEDRYTEPVKEVSQYFNWAAVRKQQFLKLLHGRKPERRKH